ncbi:class I SAM-dependent methyltransferase [Actinocrinis puniceicyclus]|uniref:Class I SAM-dependent methyltransferase n=1 Tax=Actinocrinis puniceicyclus TaxID=977794 RepID=A0A8J7WJU9_9ACTN|nr:class I SAM-dependent methyltransferase [Actinocrinis puniceicyclus]MBS2961467.1 class I SAM-dependent methyltransferase [Actinocrinis puniceicyclus]
MIQDPALSTSFGAAARDYDRYRVGPPAEIVERILPPSCEVVLDLGAGTGAMTRHLLARIPQVYAVEPDPRMREVLAENCPGVTAMEGVAERIPLPDASVDAVVMSAAWHWVDPDRAIPEVARVLRDGGTLALVWNHSDRNVPWVSDLDALRRRITGGGDVVYPRIQHFLNDPWLPEGAPFTDVEISALLWSTTLTREELSASQTTYSAFLLASADKREALLQQITEHLNGDERLGTGETVEVPMRCNFWRAVRKPREV